MLYAYLTVTQKVGVGIIVWFLISATAIASWILAIGIVTYIDKHITNDNEEHDNGTK